MRGHYSGIEITFRDVKRPETVHEPSTNGNLATGKAAVYGICFDTGKHEALAMNALHSLPVPADVPARMHIAMCRFLTACRVSGRNIAKPSCLGGTAWENEVALWHFKITVNSVGSGGAASPEAPAISASANAEESPSPPVLEFDVNQNVEPIRDTLKASHTWSSSQKQILEGLLLFKYEGHGQGSSFEDWDVVLTRHFNPIDCDSFFFVDDEWERAFAHGFPPQNLFDARGRRQPALLLI